MTHRTHSVVPFAFQRQLLDFPTVCTTVRDVLKFNRTELTRISHLDFKTVKFMFNWHYSQYTILPTWYNWDRWNFTDSFILDFMQPKKAKLQIYHWSRCSTRSESGDHLSMQMNRYGRCTNNILLLYCSARCLQNKKKTRRYQWTYEGTITH